MFECNSSSSLDWDEVGGSSNLTKRQVPRRFARAQRTHLRDENLVGLPITPEVSARAQNLRIVEGILSRFCAEGYISRTSMHSAQGFIEALPTYKQLPKVSPDGEGGVTLAWAATDSGRTLITLADWMAYGVAHAGTDQAVYLEDVSFEGAFIPDELLAVIPG